MCERSAVSAAAEKHLEQRNIRHMSPLHKDSAVLESNADRILTVSVSGGELLAFGSANPCVEERYDAGKFATYQGRALAAVRAGASGKVSASVSDGKQTATAEVNVFEK